MGHSLCLVVSVLSDPLVLLDIISGPETRAGRKVAGEMRVEKERERNFRRLHEGKGGGEKREDNTEVGRGRK